MIVLPPSKEEREQMHANNIDFEMCVAYSILECDPNIINKKAVGHLADEAWADYCKH